MASPTPPRVHVAVIGSGPAGFYTAQLLFARKDLPFEIRVDMFDRLPTPFGLVRYGVAPDHQKIKSVVNVYERVADDERFRFFGGVEFGKHLRLDDLREHYDQVVFCTGAQTDRRLGIPGEDLLGSHPATEFVAWYNGHPDYQDCRFNLDVERAVVVGVGNVAVDVARILCRTPEELAATDIAGPALEALRKSRIREVLLLGRRGPAQAAFTNPEVKELGEMTGADATALADEVELDPLSRAAVEAADDKSLRRKLEILGTLAGRPIGEKPRSLILRFLVSPTEIHGDERGRVRAVRLVRNELREGDGGYLRACATDHFEQVEAGLVFRSVGYRGVPLAEVPFDERRGVIPNDRGRVLDAPDGRRVPGLYAAGWIKRGPSGVIGTNKADAAETVEQMIGDAAETAGGLPGLRTAETVLTLLEARGVEPYGLDDWRELDRMEKEAGESVGRPRVKFVRYEQFAGALGR